MKEKKKKKASAALILLPRSLLSICRAHRPISFLRHRTSLAPLGSIKEASPETIIRQNGSKAYNMTPKFRVLLQMYYTSFDKNRGWWK
jgi:hypothetical protein